MGVQPPDIPDLSFQLEVVGMEYLTTSAPRKAGAHSLYINHLSGCYVHIALVSPRLVGWPSLGLDRELARMPEFLAQPQRGAEGKGLG